MRIKKIITGITSRFTEREVIYFDQNLREKHGYGFYYNENLFVTHTDLHHKETAFFRSTPSQLIAIFILITLLLYGLILNWHATIIFLVGILTVLYFVDLFFNLYLIYRSFAKDSEIKISPEELSSPPLGDSWPTYTILCPLFKEAVVLPQFVAALEKLDYPKDKLQILLLLEENDLDTITVARSLNLSESFEIIVVPHSFPKTKPKACNYGLQKARGEYSVIYDAEDIPDPDQLKKAVLAFKKADSQVACIQAKLNFYNPRQNLITRIFTAEYSTWFDLVLTGLESIHAPIPLGGTSNHFPTKLLKEFHGWDAFNVTEDCDLGIRLVKRGYRTAIVDSTTWEEANSQMTNWFWQRTRWIKGYIQTYFVHMRTPGHFVNNWKRPHVVTFQLVVGGKVLSMFINPLMWLITFGYFTFRFALGSFIESFFPTPVLYMAFFSIIFGNFLYMYYYMIGCTKRKEDDLLKYAFLVPFYWLAMSVSAWAAVYLFLTKPHHWSKTYHGLHLNSKKVTKLEIANVSLALKSTT